MVLLDRQLRLRHASPQAAQLFGLEASAIGEAIGMGAALDYLQAIGLERIHAWREICPDIAIRSTFVVGFPGETEADFEATLDLVRAVGYAQAYSFKYSPRPGTPAADAPGAVPEDVKTDRLARLQAVILSQQHAYNARSVGGIVEVLFDRPGGRPGQLAGRTPHMQSVHAAAPPALMGRIARVRIDAAGVSLAGEALIMSESRAAASNPTLERSAD